MEFFIQEEIKKAKITKYVGFMVPQVVALSEF